MNISFGQQKDFLKKSNFFSNILKQKIHYNYYKHFYD